MGDCISAKVESGIIKEKDEIVLMPMNMQAVVKSIEVQKERR
jgi:selenocysteine-specific translation elongation factor